MELGEAAVALIRARVAMWRRPAGALIALGEPTAASDAPAPARAEIIALGERLGESVRRAARLLPFRTECLVRSIALQTLLERRGVSGSKLCFGVRRDGDGLDAHAWVEYDGWVLADQKRHTDSYQRVADASLLSKR